MTDKEYMDQGEQYLIHTYNRFKIVLDKGEGVYLYDVNGNEIFRLCCRNSCICIRIWK